MPPTPPFDENVAHRWFAIKLNNQAWDLLEKRELSAVEQQQLVHMAHASCFHWMQIGSIVNHARALCLIANAEAAFGDPGSAMEYAQSCLDAVYSQSLYRDSEQAADWDIAFAHDARARACAAVWRQEMARAVPDQQMAQQLFQEANEQRTQARELGEAIAGAEEKQMFKQWFATGNWHGIV